MTPAEGLRFFSQSGPFRCVDYARAAGISRQAALEHLRRAVARGELEIHGVGRGTRYSLPAEPPQSRLPESDHFWRELKLRTDQVVRLGVKSRVGASCRTREQVVRLLEDRIGQLVLLDFAGVTYVSGVFARALVLRQEAFGLTAQVINAAPDVATALDLARYLRDRQPKTQYGE
jgi:hypothetical protein